MRRAEAGHRDLAVGGGHGRVRPPVMYNQLGLHLLAVRQPSWAGLDQVSGQCATAQSALLVRLHPGIGNLYTAGYGGAGRNRRPP